MTRRLWDRLKQHGRTPEVHLYEGEGHRVNSEIENQHNELLIDFFARHLRGENRMAINANQLAIRPDYDN
jgi:dipeptidyl aminopeptidase/acylaminoacyl peptidase